MLLPGHEAQPLEAGWEVAGAPPGAVADPRGLDGLDWIPAAVPGTVAGALAAAGRWAPYDERDLDAEDWWFRTSFAAEPAADGEEVVLRLGGLATLAEVFLDGERVLESISMWEEHAVDVGARLRGASELAIRFRALGPELARPRKPRARWRTRVVADGGLRWQRTMLFGRSPGFAPGPAAVGPWRLVALERRRTAVLDELALRASLAGDDGVLRVRARVRALGGGGPGTLGVRLGEHAEADLAGGAAELRLPGATRWWPHTHGTPALHDVALVLGGEAVPAARVGFRELDAVPPAGIERDGLDVRVNGVPVWARGAVWTPLDLVGLAPGPERLRRALEAVRDAGMNMLRVVGTGHYESAAFHDLCDELGILVWQDLMLANMDYPLVDPAFAATVEREARATIARLAHRPSFAVLCGNSEVEQQAAMLGQDPAAGRAPFFDETLPALLAEAGELDAACVPSTPCGGEVPFTPERGIAHYFGVSGYFGAPEEARRAEVRFAAECLAFAHVPDSVEAPVHDPRWKRGVQRDAGTSWDVGSGWDFDDVRDHYLALRHDLDPLALRRHDLERYVELSRSVSGEVTAEVLADWRRAGSTCRGALVLWLTDMLPGAGLGLVDSTGAPKLALAHVRRALAPTAVWMTDERLAGVRVHVAHDPGEPLAARLRITCLRGGEAVTGEAEVPLDLAGHATWERSVEGILGRWVDSAWAYRFGPPAQDAIVARLERAGGDFLSEAVFLPAGSPREREPVARLGLTGTATRPAEDRVVVALRTERLVHGVRLHARGWRGGDDDFALAPGPGREIVLRPAGPGPPASLATVAVGARNARDRLVVPVA